jgi:hypothetical protein
MRRLLVHAIIMIAMCGAALAQPAAEIAPSGKLRVGLAVFNPVLVSKKPDGTLGGVSVELARFIAEKLGAGGGALTWIRSAARPCAEKMSNCAH